MAVLSVWLVVLLQSMVHFGGATDEEAIAPLRSSRHRRDINDPSAVLSVTSIMSEPFLMAKENAERDENQFEGFIPDLLDMISSKTGYKFNIHIVPDGRYGMPDDTSDVGWNGMVGELIRGQSAATDAPNTADMAAADITMTAARRRVVNFVNPYQHLGLTLLAKKPASASDDTPLGYFVSSFRVLAPLDPSVWTLCILSFMVVAALLWGMNRLNPYEWKARYNMGRATEEQADTFNLSGAIWFTFTTLQWQGYERAPRSIGSRLLAAFWFMFVTLSLVTYTASLVNNLFWASAVHSNDPRDLPFRDLEELLMHPGYKIGVLQGGHSYNYLTQMAQGPEFEYLRKYLASEAGQANMAASTADAVARVRSEDNYVFITTTDVAKHQAGLQPCDLTMVGPVFGMRAYGMALRKNLKAEYAEALDHSILTLMEEGDIEALEDRWFGLGQCWNETRMEKILNLNALFLNKPRTVDLGMFWGPLVLLIVGIVISLGAAVGELFYYKYKGRYDPKNRPGGQKLALDEDNA